MTYCCPWNNATFLSIFSLVNQLKILLELISSFCTWKKHKTPHIFLFITSIFFINIICIIFIRWRKSFNDETSIEYETFLIYLHIHTVCIISSLYFSIVNFCNFEFSNYIFLKHTFEHPQRTHNLSESLISNE